MSLRTDTDPGAAISATNTRMTASQKASCQRKREERILPIVEIGKESKESRAVEREGYVTGHVVIVVGRGD